MSSETKVRFTPTHDEAARQGFIGSLKGYANFALESAMDKTFSTTLAPNFEAENGRAPETRQDAEALLRPHPIYKLWSSVCYHSQDMMWEACDRTTERTADALAERTAALAASPEKKGSLRLNPDLEIPKPISAIEIHRQPGGYITQEDDKDIRNGLQYAGTLELYANAKGMRNGTSAGSDMVGRYLAASFQKRFPDKPAPLRVLDMGCATGEQTLGVARTFPEAEVHGVEVGAPLVRYAHGFAEEEGVAVHYAQMDAANTDFPDEHFDLIVSHILFHETTHKMLPAIMAEALRLLKPGGVFYNFDVPYQPHRMSLVKQVTNHWQVQNNGEPFWTGFAELDMAEQLEKAGFEKDLIFCEYEPMGAGQYLAFGGEKR